MYGDNKVHDFKVVWNTWVNISLEIFLTQDLLNIDKDKKQAKVQIFWGLRDSNLRWIYIGL